MGTEEPKDARPEGPGAAVEAGLREVAEIVRRFQAGDYQSAGARAVDGVAGELVRELEALGSRLASEQKTREERISALSRMVVQLATLDFGARAPVGGKHDTLDGLAVGLNMLREELQSSTVSKAYLNSIFDSMADALVVTGPDGVIRTVNRATVALLGYRADELVGKRVDVLVDEAIGGGELADLRGRETRCLTKDGGAVEVSLSSSHLRDAGQVEGFVCVLRDITERKRAEEERRRLEEALKTQHELIRKMSTPLIPISDDIVVMPLVGAIDTERADQVLESLLVGIAASHPRVAIVDITAVAVVDAHVATTLLRAASAARLLGVEVILTGVRAEVARTLVELDFDLTQLITCSTLQRGIALSMRRDRSTRRP
jgi:rsbT co-antagonist protein RsbR